MRAESHRRGTRRLLPATMLALWVVACSANPDAHDAHGERCDDATEIRYKGFCVPGREDGGGNTAGTGGTGDGGADSPGIAIGACEPAGAEAPCYPRDAIGADEEGTCKLGTQLCIGAQWTNCIGYVRPVDEGCNGTDDDCDGRTDEDAAGPASCPTGREGLCGAGREVCEAGRILCQSEVEPEAESCNGDDDDCDGQADEGTSLPCYPDAATGCTANDDGSFTCVGQCATGVQDCASGEQGECGGMIMPATESCILSGDVAYDDNCDGTVDEGCLCMAGDTQSCYGGAEGTEVTPCRTGTQTCVAQTFGTCMGDRVPAQETCDNDGVDDDCDGQTDEILTRGMVCSDETMEGVCRFGEFDCEEGVFGCKTPESSTELCNGLDDNCNGPIDDGFQLLIDPLNCGQCGVQCSDGLTCCGGQCVDPTTDENHCGMCGDPCGDGSTCCDGSCVNTGTNADHCGACGEGCGDGRDCCGGGCVDTRVNIDHCGACGAECDPSESCCMGQCADDASPVCAECSEDCDAMEQCCFGSCVDQANDESNCGECGTACTSGEICCGGDCVGSDDTHCGQACAVCGTDGLCCSGSCVARDAANCTECGDICTAGMTCCGVTGCKNLQTDPNNCGVCNMPVGSGDICTSGQSCPPNNLYCNGACTYIINNEDHCGRCNNPCDGLLETCQITMCRVL